MRQFNRVLVVPLAVFISIPFTSCSSIRSCRYSDAPSGQAFLSSSTDFGDTAFLNRWTHLANEREKIDYLLDRIAASKYAFIRNGETHDGKTARRWLLYKMSHWVDHVETANDFISRVAAYSQKTGEPYVVEFPDGRVYSLKSILTNELSSFETAIAHIVQSQAQPLLVPLQPSQVSVSSTTVATTAVATSTTSS